MTKIQDQLKVMEDSALIAAEESGLGMKRFFTGMPRWQKLTLFICGVLIIPAYFGSYYISKEVTAHKYQSGLLAAHPAFQDTKPISATAVKILQVSQNQYTAYFQVTNNNLDLSAPDVSYTVDFYNSAKEKISSSSGNFFLLPDQKKYIVIPRIDSTDTVTNGQLIVSQVKWQKRLNIPAVEFSTPSPDIYDDSATSQLVVEGSVVNKSAYDIKNIQVVFLLYDKSGNVAAVSARTESNVSANGRRAYKQLWPGMQASEISKVEIFVDTNTLDSSNLNYTGGSNTPAADNPDLQL